MTFLNPVLRGMYPDPSMCAGPDGKFYLVCSTFQYFPGVPVFESEDLINWKQIGHCLTRPSQLKLEKNNTASGIYAPTIRYNKGRFYMVVTNVENIGNFYVYTDDIYGEWSDPIKVEQDGIDPSLFFDDDGKVYFISNGGDSEGRGYIQMSEIDIATGKKLTENEPLWYGTGGRYIEAPHMYKFGDYYYLLNAEGGTEYGHMVNYARSKNIKGPYEPCPANPVLTNRNMGGYQLQGAGHGDIVQAPDGTWWFCHLAFRQIDKYTMHHHLGREVCMEPVVWEDDWFYIGSKNTQPEETVCKGKVASGYNEKTGYGTALLEVKVPEEIAEKHTFAPQNFSYTKTFKNLSTKLDWCRICNYDESKYELNQDNFILTAGEKTIDTGMGSPTFIGIRQCEFEEKTEVVAEIIESCSSEGKNPEAGLTVYMDPGHHYDVYLEKRENKTYACLKATIGPAHSVNGEVEVNGKTKLKISSNAFGYTFSAENDGKDTVLGYCDSKYLSSEVNNGFCGVFLGLYAQNGARAKFTEFKTEHK
ncbi:MAG: glycoside hydrolase family 43 protein [Treponema sp.]|nr:glycoside hydrolase family 43 protein [Treponema sp.]